MSNVIYDMFDLVDTRPIEYYVNNIIPSLTRMTDFIYQIITCPGKEASFFLKKRILLPLLSFR